MDAQSAALHEWAEKNGHVIVGEYTDNGVSARKAPSKRPALQALLHDLPSNKTELIAFCKLDRWTRNVKGYYQIQDLLDKYKVAWVAIQEDYETLTSAGRLKLNLLLAIAENEADRTSDRIKAVQEHKVTKGEAITNSLPVGYSIIDKRVAPDGNADAAKAAFATFIQTANIKRTRDMLQGVYGISHTMSSVRRLLENELYIGRYRGNLDYCQPIIDETTFNEARRILNGRTVKRSPTRVVYLFSGLIFCGVCGHRMTGTQRNKYIAYRCNTHYTLRECSNSGYASEEKLENHLVTHIAEIVAGHTAQYEAEIKKPPVDRAAIQRKLDRLKDLYLDGDIDKDKYKEERNKLAPLLETEPSRPRKPTVVIGGDFAETYADLSRQQKQHFWREIIDKIVIDEKREVSIFLR